MVDLNIGIQVGEKGIVWNRAWVRLGFQPNSRSERAIQLQRGLNDKLRRRVDA